MTNEFSPDEQAHIDEVLKRIKSKDRRLFAAKDVRRLRQAITAEAQNAGELKKESVDRLIEQFQAGKL